MAATSLFRVGGVVYPASEGMRDAHIGMGIPTRDFKQYAYGMNGLPVKVNHGGPPVGRIVTWVTDRGIEYEMEIDTSRAEGAEAMRNVLEGGLRSVSFGQRPDFLDLQVASPVKETELTEVSLVTRPGVRGARIDWTRRPGEEGQTAYPFEAPDPVPIEGAAEALQVPAGESSVPSSAPAPSSSLFPSMASVGASGADVEPAAAAAPAQTDASSAGGEEVFVVPPVDLINTIKERLASGQTPEQVAEAFKTEQERQTKLQAEAKERQTMRNLVQALLRFAQTQEQQGLDESRRVIKRDTSELQGIDQKLAEGKELTMAEMNRVSGLRMDVVASGQPGATPEDGQVLYGRAQSIQLANQTAKSAAFQDAARQQQQQPPPPQPTRPTANALAQQPARPVAPAAPAAPAEPPVYQNQGSGGATYRLLEVPDANAMLAHRRAVMQRGGNVAPVILRAQGQSGRPAKLQRMTVGASGEERPLSDAAPIPVPWPTAPDQVVQNFFAVHTGGPPKNPSPDNHPAIEFYLKPLEAIQPGFSAKLRQDPSTFNFPKATLDYVLRNNKTAMP